MNRFLSICKVKRKDLMTDSFLKKMINIFESLIIWVLDTTKNSDMNIVELDGVPPADRQRLLKDMKYIELMTDILYYPTGPSGFCDLSEISEH